VVLASGQIDEFSDIFENFPIKKLSAIISGGSTRTGSVRNGLDAVNSGTARIIAVHDGVRPLVSDREITDTVSEALISGAACLATRVTDTVKKISDGRIIGTLERDGLRLAQTPQCFKYDILKQAFDQTGLLEAATDECFLVEKLGIPVSLVEGSQRNFKITTPEDLSYAEHLLGRK
jgi:2-C-methyl-D-erythritol 4-phosphate cytidylyltransferase